MLSMFLSSASGTLEACPEKGQISEEKSHSLTRNGKYVQWRVHCRSVFTCYHHHQSTNPPSSHVLISQMLPIRGGRKKNCSQCRSCCGVTSEHLARDTFAISASAERAELAKPFAASKGVQRMDGVLDVLFWGGCYSNE